MLTCSLPLFVTPFFRRVLEYHIFSGISLYSIPRVRFCFSSLHFARLNLSGSSSLKTVCLLGRFPRFVARWAIGVSSSASVVGVCTASVSTTSVVGVCTASVVSVCTASVVSVCTASSWIGVCTASVVGVCTASVSTTSVVGVCTASGTGVCTASGACVCSLSTCVSSSEESESSSSRKWANGLPSCRGVSALGVLYCPVAASSAASSTASSATSSTVGVAAAVMGGSFSTSLVLGVRRVRMS